MYYGKADDKWDALFGKKADNVGLLTKKMHFCTMENGTYIHPINLHNKKIKEEGIVVFDDVRGLPTGNDPFVSPDYVICIGHRGHIDLMYDDYCDYSEKYTIGVIFPNHNLITISKTEDYLATLIIVDVSLLSDPMMHIIEQMRYRYEPHPCVKLDKHQYRKIMNVVEVMRETARIDIPDRRILLARQLDFFLRLLSHYRASHIAEENANKRVSTQFHNNLAQHYREHRDVGFYAEKACLSTKHFSAVIKEETGYTAAHWIHTTVIAKAKMLLHIRRDLTVQAIAYMMGFGEQSVFSRYFSRETGMSPTEFREKS